MESKDVEHSERLHAYVEERAFGRDTLCARWRRPPPRWAASRSCRPAPRQAAFLELLVRRPAPGRAIEVGTFTGYGAIRIARGLPGDGTLLCLELDEKWAATAQENIDSTGVADRVEIRVGPALEALQAMPSEPTFDFAYLDADKQGYPEYYEELVPRLRPAACSASTTC